MTRVQDLIFLGCARYWAEKIDKLEQLNEATDKSREAWRAKAQELERENKELEGRNKRLTLDIEREHQEVSRLLSEHELAPRTLSGDNQEE